jgi:sporulation protein YlmC with PRC-barrel domain
VRLTDLIDKAVVTEDGDRLGIVHDVAARRDGPAVGEFGPALRVEALLVGARGVWSRLGVSTPHLRGHPVLHRLARMGRRSEEIGWDRVVRVDDDRIVVRRA